MQDINKSLVGALKKFAATLSDEKVDSNSKMRVLSTLNEVTLTLSELSESGIARAVGKLKHESGELGKTARKLITKWKQLLNQHLSKEPLVLTDEMSLKCTSSSFSNHTKDLYKDTELPKIKLPEKNVEPCDEYRLNNHTLKSGDKSFNSNQAFVETKSFNKSPVQLAANVSGQSIGLTNPIKVDNSSTDKPTFKCSLVSSTKLKVKRKAVETLDSVDSSSGLSFLESLSIGSCHRTSKKKKVKHIRKNSISSIDKGSISKNSPIPNYSTTFTSEILSSLDEDFVRPDAVYESSEQKQNTSVEENPDYDDGDLKFKSKQVLWVPRASRNALRGSVDACATQNGAVDAVIHQPVSLLDLCLDVIERNLSRVDHVGNVPYELLARTLRHASAEDLARIERYNPQFVGQSDHLWEKHIQRAIQITPGTTSIRHQPRPGETWACLYERLCREEKKRLDRIISQSAEKIRQEMQARRTTLTTEVITPRQIQRRSQQQQQRVSSKHATHSHRDSASTVNGSSANNTGATKGGLLNKLRKQFMSRRAH